MRDVLAADAKFAPYWWDLAPLCHMQGDLPPSADVVVVGCGLAGLNAALELLRAGRSVVLIDKDMPGAGGSRRAAGMLGRILKYSYSAMAKDLGLEKASAVYLEAKEAIDFTKRHIRDEGIDCYLETGTRIVTANSPTHFEKMDAEFAFMKEHLGLPYHMIGKRELSSELATDKYVGALVLPDFGSVHPGLYHKGLLELVLKAGGIVRSGVEVTGLKQAADKVTVTTDQGDTKAEQVVLATNGYTTAGLRWANRRLVPFDAYMAATEEMDPGLLAEIMPNRSTMYDARTNIDFFRPAPDRPSMLIGGATGSNMHGIEQIGQRLHRILRDVVPRLAHLRFTHVWTGNCAGTFDMMPHVGRNGRIWHGTGFNFAGIAMGTHFGRKIALQILGDPAGRSEFESFRFRPVPMIGRQRWFMPMVMKYFDWKDDRIERRA